MKQNTYTTNIDEQFIDFSGQASIPNIINAVVSTAGKDAGRNGFGIVDLGTKGCSWVLLKFAMELHCRPKLGDSLKITTWIESVSRIFSTRNFVLSNQNNEIIGEATTCWCIINSESRKPVDINSINENCNSNIYPQKSTIATPRKLKELESTPISHHKVRYSDIDFNKHFNAIRYIELMLNEAPLDLITKSNEVRVDLNFINECYLSEEVSVHYLQMGDTSNFEIRKSDNTPSARASFEWQ